MVTYSRLHRTLSRRVLNISREGDYMRCWTELRCSTWAPLSAIPPCRPATLPGSHLFLLGRWPHPILQEQSCLHRWVWWCHPCPGTCRWGSGVVTPCSSCSCWYPLSSSVSWGPRRETRNNVRACRGHHRWVSAGSLH